MGIYIKDMEMPKCCTECHLYCYDNRLRNEEERHICLLKCWTRLIRPTEERQYYCPLVEEKIGKWIEQDDEYNDTIYQCSVCGEEFVTIEGTPADNLWNYCPNCGALMVSKDE